MKALNREGRKERKGFADFALFAVKGFYRISLA
jgi:hypothetical protein